MNGIPRKRCWIGLVEAVGPEGDSPRSHPLLVNTAQGQNCKPSTALARWQGDRSSWIGRLYLLLIFACLPVFAGPASAASGEPSWAWPVPVDPPAITGTFLEAREGRYHTGLDIRTQGRTGLPVRSPVDGWVSRVRCASSGYGRALYVSTADGWTLVFAHLEEFFDPAQEPIREAQRRTGRYRQDLSIERGRIPVRAGQIVALAGDTGVGAPHLHVEVRGTDERPRDPLEFFDLPDHAPPRIEALRLVPSGLDPDPRGPVVVRREGTSPELIVPFEGMFELSVAVHDRTSTAPFRVAPRSLRWNVDGRIRAELVNDVIDFAHTSMSVLEFDRVEGTRWIRMTDSLRRGALPAETAGDSSGGEHWIVARDFAGNADSVRIRWAPQESATAVSAPEIACEPMRVVARGSKAMGELTLWNGDRPHRSRRADGAIVVAATELVSGELRLVRDGHEVARRWIFLGRERPQRMELPGGRGWIESEERDPWARGMLEFLAPPEEPGQGEVLPIGELRSHAYGFRESLRVEVADVPQRSGLAVLVLRKPGSRRWSALETERDQSSNRLVAHLSVAGELGVLYDAQPPRIDVLKAPAEFRFERRETRGPHGVRRPAYEPLVLAVEDDESGLASEDPEVLVDGEPFAARFDPEDGQLVLDWFVEPMAGAHTVQVTVRDGAGNATRRSWRVLFR